MGIKLSKKEAAARYGVSEMTLDRQRKKGLPFYKVGIQVKFDEEDLEKWFKRNK